MPACRHPFRDAERPGCRTEAEVEQIQETVPRCGYSVIDKLLLIRAQNTCPLAEVGTGITEPTWTFTVTGRVNSLPGVAAASAPIFDQHNAHLASPRSAGKPASIFQQVFQY